jgi:hypothetical protein
MLETLLLDIDIQMYLYMFRTFLFLRQNTVKSSTFGSELVASRICEDLIVAFRYKLGMFGVPIDGPANAFCDN